MKYLEQRVDELEKELSLLKAKFKLNDTSKYLNNYPKNIDPYKLETRTTGLITRNDDYMYNSSVNLMSEPELDTAFASPWDNQLDTFTFKLSSMVDDTVLNCNDIEYPNIIGSWDNSYSTNGSRTNKEDMINSWGFLSEFDKNDKDFLEYLNTKPQNNLNMKTYTEQNIEKTFGKIVSKFNILNHCWEGDGHGYIVENDGKKILILTNHGNPYIGTISELNLKISEYKTIIQETERAIFLLK